MNLQSVEVAVPEERIDSAEWGRVGVLRRAEELECFPLIIPNEANFDKEDKLLISLS